ncbi:glycosyltransferase family 2 protein [Mucilaginibacter sp. JRF]|uniref:glycosyltransferase n=1 Tax=Mucilaginibacter sp. JRF TaxID=2780088 RepID=UPI00188265F6|nr:glycosyltransferase family A protein [Mucilaginibacter sp. JRF]MBE9585878.1 glycosyltransferase family 2 protein [Mucilaginibacter sp. JRF]
MTPKFISVIIPTYKDWARLSLCLQSLATQTYDSNSFEIIVVNNYIGDKVPDDYFVPENCKIIVEEQPGSYAARNAALKIAKGEIMAFTDSDCIPDPDWLSAAVAVFQNNPGYDRIAGKIRLYYKSEKLTHAELYETVYAFNQDLYVEQDGTGVTANMFTYRKVFDQVGPFKDDLLSGGDYEWSVRARDAGFKIQYSDMVVVSHPARHAISELVKKAKRVGGGQAGFQKQSGSKFVQSVVRFLYDLRPPVRSIPLIISKGKSLHPVQKLLVFYIRYYLSVITAREKFKVSLGKSASRM